MINLQCEFCESLNVELVTYADDIDFKGLHLQLENLERHHCLECDYSFETMDVHDKNLSKIRAKFADERGAIKKRNNLLSGEEILKIRKQLGLTQRGAAELFRGGANAFSKYENEEIVQTVAMDKLIRLVAHQGEFAIHLLKNIYGLKTKPENAFEA